MTVNSDIWVVIPAAGMGSRMQSTLPKQYIAVNGQRIIEWTIARFTSLPVKVKIVVAVSGDDAVWPTLPCSKSAYIHTVTGGQTRADSVLAGLMYIQQHAQTKDPLVLVHDAARPCVSQDDILALISDVGAHGGGAILATPVAETVKRVADGAIARTVPREDLWLAQTPQAFPLSVLLPALRHGVNQGFSITDEASAVELSAGSVRIVKGRRTNIKITHPEDIDTAISFLK